MCFQPWREYGLGLFLVGLIVEIACVATWLPPPNRRLTLTLALFGLPLGLAVLPSFGILLVFWRTAGRSKAASHFATAIGVPRRFGLGTLMIVVLALASLFGAANRLNAPPLLSFCASGFFCVIGGLQMVMRRVPRTASVGTGAVLLPLTAAVTWVAASANPSPTLTALISTPADVAFLGAHLVALGAVWGYLGGTLVAGLFLVVELTSNARRREH